MAPKPFAKDAPLNRSIKHFFAPSLSSDTLESPTKKPRQDDPNVIEISEDEDKLSSGTELDEEGSQIIAQPNKEAQQIHSIQTQPSSQYREIESDDFHHVRFPFYSFVRFPHPTMAEKLIPKWPFVMKVYARPIETIAELERAIGSYQRQRFARLNGLRSYVEEKLKSHERLEFFSETLPFIINLAKRLQKVFHKPLPIMTTGRDAETHLTSEEAAILLANAFLCTFPPQPRKYGSLPGFDFIGLFQSVYPNGLEKIHCVVNYFRRLRIEKNPERLKRKITFIRKVLDKPPKWCDSDKSISRVKILKDGTIEDDGHKMIQVDFANKMIGGGVLGHGCVQEEIRFVINPELIVSRLFTTCMADNESVHILGAERYSDYKGYARTFQFSKDHFDSTERYGDRIGTYIVAIDATERVRSQFDPELVDRELNKAFCGFQGITRKNSPTLMHADFPEYSEVATGNWGCGVFGGDVRLKFVIQLLACSEAEKNMVYFTFGDEDLTKQLSDMASLLTENFSVGSLYETLVAYCSSKSSDISGENLFSFLRKAMGVDDECDANPGDDVDAVVNHVSLPSRPPGSGWGSDEDD
eukprot:TRINITY_DN8264_c0_g1_i1.p1 TRINITY_DN8264_c0_g1~~TRINITY_DN8264_c0_g1_i1.p1  ORF type:complete len:584 (-),score=128.39 TRINITY_DN8264_c0_g1_i1:143-1894(-)